MESLPSKKYLFYRLVNHSLLFFRAKIHNRASKDLSIKKYPEGNYYDIALFSLASHYKERGDIKIALKYYEKIRKYEKSDELLDSAYFYPTILLYRTGKSLKQSFTLFEELNTKRPFGPLYINYMFWKGRISEELGNQDKANEFYKKIIELYLTVIMKSVQECILILVKQQKTR